MYVTTVLLFSVHACALLTSICEQLKGHFLYFFVIKEVLASCIIKEQQQIWHVVTKKKAQSSKSNSTSSAVLMEEGLPGKKRSPTESNDSPRSFLMSSSSLSRLTPLTTLSDFVALDPDLTPTAPPFGNPAAAVVVVMSLTVTAALFLRKRIDQLVGQIQQRLNEIDCFNRVRYLNNKVLCY